jgi:tetratricopeptide (TPR) repeat protein
MKYFLAALVLISNTTIAQLHLPQLSQKTTITQDVGYTTIMIRYERPEARERKIMGELVRYGRLWRTGAGKCTTISFNTDVTLDGKTVKAGAYALLTIPDTDKWTVLLNTDTSKVYGDPSEYNEKNEVLRFTVKPEKTERYYHSMTFDLDIKKYDAILYLSWENTQIRFPILTGSHQRALATIKTTLENEPKNQEAYAMAAEYYTMNNEDPQQALSFLDKALALGEERWVYYQKVEVFEKMKNYAKARETAQAAIAFLKRTKPVEWDYAVNEYESRIKTWPAK